MTLYARCPRDVDLNHAPYLTPGKEYLVGSPDEFGGFHIINDLGLENFCIWKNCAHLDGGNWERVEKGGEQ